MAALMLMLETSTTVCGLVIVPLGSTNVI